MFHYLQFAEEDFKAQFLGVSLHELECTRTPFLGQTREFKNLLTELLGQVGVEEIS